MATAVQAAPTPLSRPVKTISWILRALAIAAFLVAGGAKLYGAPMMVGIFEQIGAGQWFRLATGAIEVAGAIALLLPTTVAFGGLLLATTMLFAILTHLFVIGGSPVPAMGLLLITATIAWLHRSGFRTGLR